MTGKVIKFDSDTNEGLIFGEDKEKYNFHIGEWLDNCRIRIGQEVYYEVEEDEARNITINSPIFTLKIDICLV